MALSKAQQWWLIRPSKGGLWYDACVAQGWDHTDDDLRYWFYGDVLGRIPRHASTLASGLQIRSRDMDNSDFDAIKARLLTLADNLVGAVEDGHPDIGERRRLIDILDGLMRCLNLYVSSADDYLAPILRQRFHHSSIPCLVDHCVRAHDNRDLNLLIQTINARINGRNGLRARSGDSIHDMLIRVGLRCHCRVCKQVPALKDSSDLPY